MKKLLILIATLSGCASQKESWQTQHLYQRLVLKTKTDKGFEMVPVTAWEPYRELDHRVGGDTLIQYTKKR